MTLLKLFWSFCKIGFTSFGGLSMIPVISSEMLSNMWMNAGEISDIVAIAEMTPGPLGLNCATFAGMRVAGLWGAVIANLGILLPTLTLGSVAAVFFERFKKSDIFSGIMLTVRPICVGLIWAVIIDLCLTNYFGSGGFSLKGVVVAIIALLMLMKLKLGVPVVILISAGLGILLF